MPRLRLPQTLWLLYLHFHLLLGKPIGDVTSELPATGETGLESGYVHVKDSVVDWHQVGQQTLQNKLNQKANHGVARNVILFVGDGMGVSTVTAARLYRRQQGLSDPRLVFEKLPHVALSKTYDVDHYVADSASTATAMLAGVKTKHETLGLNQNVIMNNCPSSKGNEVDSVLRMSLKKGKSAGIVTTARLTHATPAAAYAHSANRNWESDVTDPNGGCTDIAHQLIHENPDIQVLLGGGRTNFIPTNETDPEYPDTTGRRKDDKNLIQAWSEDKKGRHLKHRYVWNQEQFKNVDPAKTDYLLGLFEPSHMQYELDRNSTAEPSLAEMVEKSINILKKNRKGFFLEVEGGRIDHAHHDSNAKRSLVDTWALSDAVQKALDMVDIRDTLIIVTADHSHVFTIGGYPTNQVPLLGVTDHNYGLDGLPYTVLGYTNGPGYKIDGRTGRRENLTGVDTTADDYTQQSAVPLKSETHGGEEVAVYASGPMSHLFSGSNEQNYIAHVITYASCIGDKQAHCASGALKSYKQTVLIYIPVLFSYINFFKF